jgi:cell division protein ZapE
MTLRRIYQQQLDSGQLLPDAAQAQVVEQLQSLLLRLSGRTPVGRGNGLFRRLLKNGRESAPEPGLYICGGVGRGKTWLLDLFYNQLPFDDKLRLHFHRFMREVHQRLSRLKGEKDPLERVAADLAEKSRVLCLDEFIVSDIGDAMILGGLLRALFKRGVTLVITSNTEPHRLYQDGIQRASFLPAIALLEKHTRVVQLTSSTDYRLRYLKQVRVYHTPLGAAVNRMLEEEFRRLAPEQGQCGGAISLFGRTIPVRQLADDLVWFDFMALCGPPRSQTDYLELARCYHTVLISDIPTLGPAQDDATRRLIYLLDEFYDRNVKLIISAAEPPESLYQGERLAFDFQRAVSRLREMQSAAYLARAHKP